MIQKINWLPKSKKNNGGESTTDILLISAIALSIVSAFFFFLDKQQEIKHIENREKTIYNDTTESVKKWNYHKY